MIAIPHTQEACRLLHDGAIALAEVESNGIRIDEEYLEKTIFRTKRKIKHLKAGLQTSEVISIWKRLYKNKTNLNSTEQLGKVLFDAMGFDCPSRTPPSKGFPEGKYKTDEKSLGAVDHPFVQAYLKIKKLQKSLRTYLMGIQREIVDGYIHPFFNLHTTRSYRSSSNDPNFQNIPIRIPEISELIRKAFIARKGRRLVELDYGGAEIVSAACYHQDPAMIAYLEDKTKDMHRDMAMECYKLPEDQVTKDIRYCGKNMFVFPQFFGDWYIQCAQSLWEACLTMKLETKDGIPLREHLASQGIVELGDLNPKEKPRQGTMERVIQRAESQFWKKRFPVYGQWRKDWVAAYRKQGWMESLTGFIYQGWLDRKQIVNYPVQGSAFHCLLWALIELQKEMKKARMRGLLIGQIHDSLIGDIPDEEMDDFLPMAHEVMIDRLLDHWDWITVPLEIEAEVTPIEGNWFEKSEEWRSAS